MIVGVISDTHDRLDGLQKAIAIFKDKQIEVMVHCGDWVSPFTYQYFNDECQRIGLKVPVYSVIGNNPGDLKRVIEENSTRNNPILFAKREVNELELDRRKGVIYHGTDKVILNSLINSGQYDVVFTGHTHRVRNEVVSKTLVLNPGSVNYACEGRIITTATVAVYTSESNTAEIIFLD